jgi:hypothetical protein
MRPASKAASAVIKKTAVVSIGLRFIGAGLGCHPASHQMARPPVEKSVG